MAEGQGLSPNNIKPEHAGNTGEHEVRLRPVQKTRPTQRRPAGIGIESSYPNAYVPEIQRFTCWEK